MTVKIILTFLRQNSNLANNNDTSYSWWILMW